MTTPIASTSSLGSTTPVEQPKPGTLGKDDFLKLLAARLRQQDPMNAQKDEEFMNQLTQFSILEQITNLARSQEQATGAANTAQLVALIGKTVTYTKADGTTGEGVVERLSFGSDGQMLSVGGLDVAPADVTAVR
ncbi:MAG: flagellar hook capping FlgD N-terminal domain-containing protein [Actinomycetes bacterium]